MPRIAFPHPPPSNASVGVGVGIVGGVVCVQTPVRTRSSCATRSDQDEDSELNDRVNRET